jgi:hypothetical protein
VSRHHDAAASSRQVARTHRSGDPLLAAVTLPVAGTVAVCTVTVDRLRRWHRGPVRRVR